MESLRRIITKSIGLPALLLLLVLGGLVVLALPAGAPAHISCDRSGTAVVPDRTGLNATAPEETPQAAETFAGRARLERGTLRQNTAWEQRSSGTTGKCPRPLPRIPVAAVPDTPQLRYQWQCFRRYALHCGIPTYLQEFLADHQVVRAGPGTPRA